MVSLSFGLNRRITISASSKHIEIASWLLDPKLFGMRCFGTFLFFGVLVGFCFFFNKKYLVKITEKYSPPCSKWQIILIMEFC